MSASQATPSPRERTEASSAPRPATSLPKSDNDLNVLVNDYMSRDTLTFLVVFRVINAVCVNTFFQPDEYFQSREPAWDLVFGQQSGAWLTWEWQHQLRSSLHPLLFSVVYFVADQFLSLIHIAPHLRASFMTIAPAIFQAFISAVGDYYTWKLAEKLYGRGSNTAWTALVLSVANPWNWFCSTRTFSNSLETTLTIAALHYWPWQLYGEPVSSKIPLKGRSAPVASLKSFEQGVFQTTQEVNQLRACFLLSGLACILRPTNLLVWFSLVTVALTRLGLIGESRAKSRDYVILFREAIFCGLLVIGISAVSDYFYFGFWTFPPYQWLNFNINQSLAVFYGQNDWHYYLSQGIPLLLTTYLPFGLIALWSSASTPDETLPALTSNVRYQLTFSILVMISTLSLISHKEVRFIYPLLPSLHVLMAPHVLAYLTSSTLASTIRNRSALAVVEIKGAKRRIMYVVIVLNILIALYTTQVHQRGVINVMSFLRKDFQRLHIEKPALPDAHLSQADETFAAFLMPCHSTPWRSHLVFPGLKAWALTCEPPLDIPAGTEARKNYRDEADRFYDDQVGFLRREVNTKERPWPRYVVGFEGIESALKEYYENEMKGFKVREKWRGGNSQWHDDWRRVGDVVVWEFVDPSSAES